MAASAQTKWPMQVQYLRVMLSVVATSTVLLAANVSFVVRQSTRSPLLNGMLLVWIVTLVSGEVYGLIAALRNRLAFSAQEAVYWLVMAALHVWYMLDGRHDVPLLSQSDRWSLLAQVFCDLLCVVCITAMALLLRWHAFVLRDASAKLQALGAHTVRPMPGNAVEIHVVV